MSDRSAVHHRHHRSRGYDCREDEAYAREEPRFDPETDGWCGRSYEHAGWMCLECNERMYGNRCSLCERKIPDNHPRNIFASNKRKDDNAPKVDEFGRVVRPKQQSVKPSWPPCFETHGGAFVLDARSGMFYEVLSDFFYNPANKLYYGNKSKQYYQYNKKLKPPFEVVEYKNGDTQGEDGEDGAHVQVAAVASKVAVVTGPKIFINLTTKTLPKKKKVKMSSSSTSNNTEAAVITAAPVTPAAVTTPTMRKEHAVDIEKWAARSEELKKEELEPEKKKAKVETIQVYYAKDGKPVCMLCRRKFANVPMLQKHEQQSDLHKANAEKQQKDKSTEPVYVDRAQLRRELHNEDQHCQAAAVNVDTDVKAVIGDGLGMNMLKKQGWTNGSSVGMRKSSNAQHESLSKDWDRIESAATKR